MSTLYGTSYFVNEWSAVLYYRDYAETTRHARHLVRDKIAAGEIHIGAPGPLKIGERLTLVDGGRRYAIAVDD
jgi:hypothetical protein